MAAYGAHDLVAQMGQMNLNEGPAPQQHAPLPVDAMSAMPPMGAYPGMPQQGAPLPGAPGPMGVPPQHPGVPLSSAHQTCVPPPHYGGPAQMQAPAAWNPQQPVDAPPRPPAAP